MCILHSFFPSFYHYEAEAEADAEAHKVESEAEADAEAETEPDVAPPLGGSSAVPGSVW